MDENDIKTSTKPKSFESRVFKNHPTDAIIGGIIEGRKRGKKNVDYREMAGVINMAY